MLRQFLCSGFSCLLRGTIFCQPFLHTYLQAWFVGTSHGTCALRSRDNSGWSETVSPGGQVACWGGFLELFTEWVGSRAYAQPGELWDDMGSSLQNKGYLGSNLCPGQANKSEFKLHPDLPEGYCMWMIDHLGSWAEAKALSLQWMPSCSQTNLTGSGLMVPLLCSALFSSLKHPRYCSRDRWRFRRCVRSWGACLCQPGVRGFRVVGSVSFWIICKAEALTVCAY